MHGEWVELALSPQWPVTGKDQLVIPGPTGMGQLSCAYNTRDSSPAWDKWQFS